MSQVSLIEAGSVSQLEEKVNNFLSEICQHEGIEIIDIKFNSYNAGERRYEYHTAMIIYKS